MVALAPAFAMGALALAMWGQPAATPLIFQLSATLPVTPLSGSSSILPVSSTFVVKSVHHSQPLVLRGRLEALAGKSVTAPISGLVARILVQPGQVVAAGQPVAMISDQAAPAVDQAKVAVQQQAESAQESAARQQAILQGKLEQEQQLLKAAHQRVALASGRLTNARDLLQRMQNGEKITSSELIAAGAQTPTSNTKQAPSSQASQSTSEATHAVDVNQQQADQAAKNAAQKWQVLHVLLMRQTAAKNASTSNGNNVNAVDTTAPSQADIDNARQNAQKAQAEADSARQKAFVLLQRLNRDAANNSATPQSAGGGNLITLADATRIAHAALQESKDALAQADAIQSQIKRYQTPVKAASNRITAATSNLENAQRSLFDNPARVQMTPVVASSAGVVQTVQPLATQVNVGDEIATVAPEKLLQLELRDSTGLWRQLRLNTKFMVKVQTPSPPKDGADTSTVARLTQIVPPENPGQPAVLLLQVFNPLQKKEAVAQKVSVPPTPTLPAPLAHWFSPGMVAVCTVMPVGNDITIPRDALRMGPDGQYQVAVLQPLNPYAPKLEQFHIEWRNVIVNNVSSNTANGNTAPSNAAVNASVPILSGLLDGDRIALRPQMLYHLIEAKGMHATVQISET